MTPRTLIAVLGVVAIAAFTALLCTWPPGSSADTAAWVQGGGTIVAVVASAGIVSWQHRLERDATLQAGREERFRLLSAALELVGGTAQVLEKASSAAEDVPQTEWRNAFRAELGTLITAMASLDLARFEPSCIRAVLISSGAAQATLGMVDVGEQRACQENVFFQGAARVDSLEEIRISARATVEIVKFQAKELAKAVEQVEREAGLVPPRKRASPDPLGAASKSS